MSAYNHRHLDIAAFASAAAVLERSDPLAGYERLLEETEGRGADRLLRWRAQGAQQVDASGQAQNWLHMRAEGMLSLTCQRCLEPVDVALEVSRSFRFVPTEVQAEAEDEMAEEDVLAISRDFDLQALVEDELLMELPLVPAHEVCPGQVKLSVADADFEEAQPAKPNPFAVLSGLKKNGPS